MKREDFVFDHMDDEYEDYWFKVVGDTKDELTKKYMEMCMVSVTEVVYSKPCQMFNVGAMMPWMDYTPRTLDEIIAANSHNEAVRNK